MVCMLHGQGMDELPAGGLNLIFDREPFSIANAHKGVAVGSLELERAVGIQR